MYGDLTDGRNTQHRTSSTQKGLAATAGARTRIILVWQSISTTSFSLPSISLSLSSSHYLLPNTANSTTSPTHVESVLHGHLKEPYILLPLMYDFGVIRLPIGAE
jgi:hypothetical protein